MIPSGPEKNEEAVGTAELSPQCQRLLELREEYGATWETPDDPRDPYNWKPWRKVTISILVSSAQLVTLMSASMTTAALSQIATDVGMSVPQAQISFSIYFLGMAFAPFFIAAVSEMFGRRPVWLISNVYFILWNTLCPVGRNKGLMIAGRFMSASGASAGVVLTGPIMTDMYTADMRGRSLAMAGLLPYLGPALGPIVGGVAAQNLDWPWLFWIISIFAAAITLVGFLFLPESYTPVLLHRKAKAENPDDPRFRAFSPTTRAFYRDLLTRLRAGVYRPVRLLLRRPIMQYIAFNGGLNFGIYSIMLSTFAQLFMDRYHESETISSLNYIAIALGTTLASQIGGRVMDYIWRRLTQRYNGETRPEYRAPYMAPGVSMGAVGLVWYGWAAEKGAPWVVVDVGATVFIVGIFITSGAFLAYTFDEFKHAASASAACRLLTYILGFVFPIFAPDLYSRLGYGWGNSLLALIWVVFGVPAPLVLWLWGPKLRAMGKDE